MPDMSPAQTRITSWRTSTLFRGGRGRIGFFLCCVVWGVLGGSLWARMPDQTGQTGLRDDRLWPLPLSRGGWEKGIRTGGNRQFVCRLDQTSPLPVQPGDILALAGSGRARVMGVHRA